jgi:hypothetical protein
VAPLQFESHCSQFGPSPLQTAGQPCMELPNESHVRLVAHCGETVLQHCITKEIVTLPAPAGSSYSLHFDADGDGYLSSGLEGGTTEWVSQHLSATVVMDDSRACYVVQGDTVTALSAYFNEYVQTEFKVPLAGATVMCKGWRFLHNQGGAYLFWDVGALYMLLQVGSDWPSKWYLRRWADWETLVGRMGMPSHHMRKAVRTQQAVKTPPGPSAPWHIDARCLPHHSMSTAALLRCVCRWVNPRNARRQIKEVMAWRAFLGGLLRECLPKELVVPIFLDQKVELDFDAAWHGSGLVKLPCKDGQLDMTCLHGQYKVLHEPCDEGSLQAPLFEVLLCAERLGARLMHVFKQLIYFLAMTLELHFTGAQGESTVASCKRISKKALILQNRLAQCCRARLCQSLTEKLCRYYFAGRKAFFRPPFLGLAVDGSRLGMKAVLVGIVSLPSNITMWGPPQALSSLPQYTVLACAWQSVRIVATTLLKGSFLECVVEGLHVCVCVTPLGNAFPDDQHAKHDIHTRVYPIAGHVEVQVISAPV